MQNRAHFEVKIVESLETYPARDEREAITAADLVATLAEVLESLKATPGAPAVLKRLPQLEKTALWFSTAYFSVCQKTGTNQSAARVAPVGWRGITPGSVRSGAHYASGNARAALGKIRVCLTLTIACAMTGRWSSEPLPVYLSLRTRGRVAISVSGSSTPSKSSMETRLPAARQSGAAGTLTQSSVARRYPRPGAFGCIIQTVQL
jgi:hypothetical protein